jgi:hypothetical protein
MLNLTGLKLCVVLKVQMNFTFMVGLVHSIAIEEVINGNKLPANDV